MPVWLNINARSGVPIYLQLIEQVRHALEVGTLQRGDTLPTVRDLASDLTIAPNTVVKAYNELQRMGLIESRQGSGTVVVAELNGTLRRHQVAALYERLRLLVRDAAGLEVPAADLAARFNDVVREFYPDTESEETP
jgi:GntR family transcriptional regulator